MATAGGGDKHFPTESGGCCRAREVAVVQANAGSFRSIGEPASILNAVPRRLRRRPLAPFLWRRSARCRSRSISCVRSARPWRCSFGRRRRDQRGNGRAPFQSSVPRDFLSALRPARAVPAHRRRGDGADKNEATVRPRYHQDAIHEQADRCWIQRPCRRALVRLLRRLNLKLWLLQLRAVV